MMPDRMNLAHSMRTTIRRSVERTHSEAEMSKVNAKSYARSAAAFAVVGVRLGLPLESVDTIPQITLAQINPEEEERKAVAGSCARLVESELDAWIDALPDPAAVARLTDVATMAGALCISEGKEGRTVKDSLGAHTAAYMMREIARGLDHDDPEERKRWVEQRVLDALMILVQDGEAAWNRIRSELEQRGYLSGEEVRALIAESDAEVARRSPGGTPDAIQ
jgi:hypothetical protein